MTTCFDCSTPIPSVVLVCTACAEIRATAHPQHWLGRLCNEMVEAGRATNALHGGKTA